MTAGPRERLIDSTIALIRRRGVHATGLTDLLNHSGTARQSIYQHFPGGKAELVEQATQEAGRQMVALLDTLGDEPLQLVDGLISWWEQQLASSSYDAGCPIVAAALSPTPAAGRVFAAWENRLGGVLVQSGLDQTVAASLATFTLSALEGAIVLSRAAQSTRPLDEARTQLTLLLKAHLGPRATTTSHPEPDADDAPMTAPIPILRGYQHPADARDRRDNLHG